MKKIKILFFSSLAAMLFACNTLDVPPLNVVKDAEIFGDQAGVNAFMAGLYGTLPIMSSDPSRQRPDYGGRDQELSTYNVLQKIADMGNVGSNTNEWWSYTNIRSACYFIQEFPAYADKFSETYANAWLGEAYFIRAFSLFYMVQCYGGMPIVDHVLNYPEVSAEELRLPRNKEDDCYQSILADLKIAADLLPEASTTDVGLSLGRVNKYAALALRSRVALHAGCIAKYGSELLQSWSSEKAVQDGIVGVPVSKANEYFQSAWNDAKTVENSGKYELFGADQTNTDDIINSYRLMYLKRGNPDKEIIFGRHFLAPTMSSGTDGNCLPYQMGTSYAMKMSPPMEFISLFDDIDGNPINWQGNNWSAVTGNDANPVLFKDITEPFANAEPRFRALMLYPDAVYKGEKIGIRKGILQSGEPYKPLDWSKVLTTTSWMQEYNGMRISGASGMGNDASTYSGFFLIKYFDENLSYAAATGNPSQTEAIWPEIRYTEMLLTLAEAAVEMGKPDEAVPYMNAIRKRAGSKKVFTTVSLEDVRKERRIEMVWEGRAFWDLRRWRIFHKEIDNTALHIMWPIYIWDEDAYYLRITDTNTSDGKIFTYDSRYYYMAIPAGQISSNGNLIQNPGY
jgi:hypothetical protein